MQIDPITAIQLEPSSIRPTGTNRPMNRQNPTATAASTNISGATRPRVIARRLNTTVHAARTTRPPTTQRTLTGGTAASSAVGTPTTTLPTRSATAMRSVVCCKGRRCGGVRSGCASAGGSATSRSVSDPSPDGLPRAVSLRARASDVKTLD